MDVKDSKDSAGNLGVNDCECKNLTGDVKGNMDAV